MEEARKDPDPSHRYAGFSRDDLTWGFRRLLGAGSVALVGGVIATVLGVLALLDGVDIGVLAVLSGLFFVPVGLYLLWDARRVWRRRQGVPST